MRKSALGAAVFLIAISAIGRAQQLPQATFRAGTTLVDFSVVVVDGRGNPVTDLRKDEISIVEDTDAREVAFFQFEGAAPHGPAAAPHAALAAGSFSNRPEYAPGAPRNLIAIVVDLINTSLAKQVQIQTELLHYLKQIPPEAHVGLYLISEHAVAIHDYTQDVESLRARLEKGEIDIHALATSSSARDIQGMTANARPETQSSMAALAAATARGEGDRNLQVMKWRRNATLQALESVGRHVAGVPGRKSLVWVSYGFPLTDTFGTYTDSVTATSQLLASQNVSIYPVDAAGVGGAALYGADLGMSDQSRSSASRGQRPTENSRAVTAGNHVGSVSKGRVQGTSEVMAAITGGRVTRKDNELTAGVVAAAADQRGAYSVGFYAAAEPDNRWHRLTVKISRPGLTVRHRQGYLAAATALGNAQNWSQAQWNDVAFRPLASTAVRFDGRATFTSGTLRTVLDINAADLQPRQSGSIATADVDIAVVERSATATTNVRVQSASLRLNAETAPVVPVASEFALNPGTVAVRVIVRDKSTNRYGSVDLTLAQLPAK